MQNMTTREREVVTETLKKLRVRELEEVLHHLCNCYDWEYVNNITNDILFEIRRDS